MGIEESFQPGLVFGEDTKIYLDQKKKQLIVSSSTDFKGESTAIITSEQIIACETDITDCEFHITLKLRPPGPDQLHVLLNSRTRPQGPQDDLYLEFQMQLQELADIIRRWNYKPIPGDHYLGPIPGYFENLRKQQTPSDGIHPIQAAQTGPSSSEGDWKCFCGTANTGNFCCECGRPRT